MKLALLGAGPGGYVAALKAAQLGAEVTVIEAAEVGGTCLNRGCIPTKTVITSTALLAKTRDLESFGLELSGRVIPNLAKIVARKDRVVGTLVKGIRSLFKSWGITLREGRGTLLSPNRIEVTGRDGSREIIEADRIIIATGSRPADIPAFPFDGRTILSSTEALALTEIPKSLLIVGAGVIGCEFACIYRELGTDVTMIEALPRAVATEDHEISEQLEHELKKKKIRLITNTKAERVERRDDGFHASLSNGAVIGAEKVLVSVGRKPNSEGIGLENAGIAVGSRGEIAVSSRMETNVPGVYAVGDVIGGVLLAHVASAEGIVAAKNIMGEDAEIDYTVIPAAIFTSPEIASVGIREQEARDRGMRYRTGNFPFRMLGRAHAMGETSGFIKIISEEATDRIIGAHIIGPHASDLIHEAAVAMRAGLTAGDIANTIHAHPTLGEGVMEAAEAVHGQAIHVLRQ